MEQPSIISVLGHRLTHFVVLNYGAICVGRARTAQ